MVALILHQALPLVEVLEPPELDAASGVEDSRAATKVNAYLATDETS